MDINNKKKFLSLIVEKILKYNFLGLELEHKHF